MKVRSAEIIRASALYPKAIVLGIVALIIHALGHGQVVEASHRKALDIEEAHRRQVQYVSNPETKRVSNFAKVLNMVGFAFTVLSALCTILAYRRREPGWYSIPLTLLLFDFLTLMLL